MPTITSLESQKTNRERLSVFVDGAFFCGVTIDDAVCNRLATGMEISESDLAELAKSAGENDLYNKAVAYILTSPKTERQVNQYLFKKEPSRDVREKITERLQNAGLVNDESYAELFAETKSSKMSIRAIKSKLMARGVNATLAEETVSKLDTGGQAEIAMVAAEKYMRSKDRDTKNLLKLNRFLVTKGFDFETVNDILSQYKGGHE